MHYIIHMSTGTDDILPSSQDYHDEISHRLPCAMGGWSQ